ncbi:MAG: hypothetical protein ACKO38_19020 [Planctomycetota bacterium]
MNWVAVAMRAAGQNVPNNAVYNLPTDSKRDGLVTLDPTVRCGS